MEKTKETPLNENDETLMKMLSNLFLEPSVLIEWILRKPTFLFPIIVLVFVNSTVLAWYFSSVDFQWFVDLTLQKMGSLTVEEVQQAKKGLLEVGPVSMAITNIVSSMILIILIYVVHAVYLTLISNLAGTPRSFKTWFSLCSWAGLVAVFTPIAMAINILLADSGMLNLSTINSLSLSGLGFEASNNPALQSLFDTLSIPMVWTLLVISLAYRQWMSTSWANSFLIVCVPYLVTFGIWAVLAVK